MSFSHSRDSREFCFLNFVADQKKASKLTFFNSALDPLKLLGRWWPAVQFSTRRRRHF